MLKGTEIENFALWTPPTTFYLFVFLGEADSIHIHHNYKTQITNILLEMLMQNLIPDILKWRITDVKHTVSTSGLLFMASDVH